MLGWRDLPSQAEGSHPDPFNPPQFIYLILIFHPYFYIFKKKNQINREPGTYSTHHETDETFLIPSHRVQN